MNIQLILIFIVLLVGIVIFYLRISKNEEEQVKEYRSLEEIVPELQQKIAARKGKIDLIKFVRNETGLGLAEAKMFVEEQIQPDSSQAVDRADFLVIVQKMLQAGEGYIKIIKYVRDETGLGLKDAKEFVDHAKSEMNVR